MVRVRPFCCRIHSIYERTGVSERTLEGLEHSAIIRSVSILDRYPQSFVRVLRLVLIIESYKSVRSRAVGRQYCAIFGLG
jgi:hypothetical protein